MDKGGWQREGRRKKGECKKSIVRANHNAEHNKDHRDTERTRGLIMWLNWSKLSILDSIRLVFTSKVSPENINCRDGLCCRDRFTGGSSSILSVIKCVCVCVCVCVCAGVCKFRKCLSKCGRKFRDRQRLLQNCLQAFIWSLLRKTHQKT